MLDHGPALALMDQGRKKQIEMDRLAMSAGSGRDSDRARLRSLAMEETAIEARGKMLGRATELHSKAAGGDAAQRLVDKVLKAPGVGVPGLGSENADMRKGAGLLPTVGLDVGLSLGSGGDRDRTALAGHGDRPDPSARSDRDRDDDGLTAIFGPTGYSKVRDPLGPAEADGSGGMDTSTAAGRGLGLAAIAEDQVAMRADSARRVLGIDGQDLAGPARLPDGWPGRGAYV